MTGRDTPHARPRAVFDGTWNANQLESLYTYSSTHKDVGHVLVLAEKRKVEENLDRLGICMNTRQIDSPIARAQLAHQQS